MREASRSAFFRILAIRHGRFLCEFGKHRHRLNRRLVETNPEREWECDVFVRVNTELRVHFTAVVAFELLSNFGGSLNNSSESTCPILSVFQVQLDHDNDHSLHIGFNME